MLHLIHSPLEILSRILNIYFRVLSPRNSLCYILSQFMSHIDDVVVTHAARNVVSGIIEEEDEAHLINGARPPLEKR